MKASHFLEDFEINQILSNFGLTLHSITDFHDTSHNDNDKRINYIIDNKYVLKINSVGAMWEARLQEIRRLIYRYREIGVYCPDLIPTLSGSLSHRLCKNGKEYTCFVEEYAKYPISGNEIEYDRKEVIEHLGILASKYTNVDLSKTKSMWSIIDLAPLDVDIDEKQENADTLINSLRENGYEDLALQLQKFNVTLREKISTVFDKLPRCVYQGDLNSTNELHKDGHFAGLIDFNMSGTDVNINVFLNETNWFPETDEFDSLSIAEIISRQDAEQENNLSVILRHYTLNDIERYAFPYYKRIVNLFQYPDVCSMTEWLNNERRRDKCAKLIQALVDKSL